MRAYQKKILSILIAIMLITNWFPTDSVFAEEAVPVIEIIITTENNAEEVEVNGSLQIYAEVLPKDAVNKTIVWSVADGIEGASIDEHGLLTGIAPGTILVQAAANDGSGVYETVEIEVTAASVLENDQIAAAPMSMDAPLQMELAEGDVYLPDTNFFIALKNQYASISGEWVDQTIPASHVPAITRIDVWEKNISSLEGIEGFTALQNLQCPYNQLTTLDVSKNTALTYLDCSHNQLTILDVSQNTALESLVCYYNQLTTLDVSKNIKLTLLAVARIN